MKNAIDNTKDIQDILLEIGMPANLSGFAYLITAIQLALDDPSVLHHITGGLYVKVAREHATTPDRVERALRHAILVTWAQGDLDSIDFIFKNSVDPMKGYPTNSQFVARMYYYFHNSR